MARVSSQSYIECDCVVRMLSQQLTVVNLLFHLKTYDQYGEAMIIYVL